jgi:hypothetical protein
MYSYIRNWDDIGEKETDFVVYGTVSGPWRRGEWQWRGGSGANRRGLSRRFE